MSISSIVKVTITKGGPSVTQRGFGVPLILGEHTRFIERIRTYQTIQEVDEDFLESDPERVKALAAFSQSVKPEKVKIGRRLTPVAQVTNIAVDNVIDDTEYTVLIDGVPFSFTSGVATTADLIVDGLIIAINAGSLPITLQDNGPDFDITGDNAGEFFDINVTADPNLSKTDTVPSIGLASDIFDIEQIDDDWYFLIITTTTDLDITEAAKAIEARLKVFSAVSRDASILTTAISDIGSELKSRNFARTFLSYISDNDSHPDAAWVGLLAPEDPGSVTWKFKTLAGVAVDNLTSTEKQNAQGKNVNIYTEVGGIAITEEGIVSSGEFIDIIRGIDFLQARIEENVFQTLVDVKKVPYEDAGVDLIKSKISQILQLGIDQQILAPDPTPVVTAPLVVDIPSPTKASRLLPDVRFTATLSGAIHAVEIDGFVQV